jgi:hypothetical protein
MNLIKIKDTIDFLAKDMWNKIKFAKNNKLQYGEETVTNVSLVALQLTLINGNFKNWFFIKQISKKDESELGYDFEFAFHKSGKWFLIPIQAKIMKDECYPELSHSVTDKNGVSNKKTTVRVKQIEKFYDYCKNDKNKWGLYSFYNYSNNIPHLKNYWNCKDQSTIFSNDLLGWTFVSLDSVYNKYKNNGRFVKQFIKLHEPSNSFPARCLLCKLKSKMKANAIEFKENIVLNRYLDKSNGVHYNNGEMINAVENEDGTLTYPKNIIGIDLDSFDDNSELQNCIPMDLSANPNMHSDIDW